MATRVAGLLTTQAQGLPHDITERLRVAREQAMVRARQVRLQAVAPASLAAGGVMVNSAGGSAATLSAQPMGWFRAASLLPLLALVVGLVLIDQWMSSEQMQSAADMDAQLLADDLPPAAFTDPGFAQYLRDAPEPPSPS